ncbi:MAG: ROK family protein, partial [Actinomycetota bacterium]
MTMDLATAHPEIVPPLDPGFRPAVLVNRAFRAAVEASGEGVTLRIGLQRPDGAISVFETVVYADGSESMAANYGYVERLVKFLLWQRGASKVLISGSKGVVGHLRKVYSPNGARAFDVDFMTRVYETPFTIEYTDAVPDTLEPTVSLGRHLEGNRIGFDLGASDYKISAVIDGEAVYADEFPWMPRDATELSYHYERITAGLRTAAEHLPTVDAIGGSSAGVWIDDRVRVASLFRGLSR